MRVKLFDIDTLPPAEVELWDRLLAALPVPSPFLSYSFCRAVHHARGGVRVLKIGTNRGETGFLPFQIKAGRGPLGHAEKTGGNLSDMFGIVGSIRSVLDPQEILRSAGISTIRFDHGVPELCPFPFLDREDAAGIRVRVDEFGPYLAALVRSEKEFVKTVERSERQLEKEVGKISFVWNAVDSAQALEGLIACKREQYRRTGKRDGLRPAWCRNLLFSLLTQQDSLCRPVLSVLHADDVWIASNLAIACEETLHIWYPAYNPAYRRFGPGHLIFFRLFEHGTTHGMRWFDFGEGEATYKSRYHGEHYPLWKGVIRRPSVRGYSERVLQSLQWRIERGLPGWFGRQVALEAAPIVARAGRNV